MKRFNEKLVVLSGAAAGIGYSTALRLADEGANLIVIDYDANDVVFFTIVDYNQVVKNNTLDLSLFGKKGHQRKNEEGKAKVDFSMRSVQNGIDNKVTFNYDFNNPDNEGLSNFLEEKLGK